MSDNFQLSLFDEEPEEESLDYIAIDFETANQYGRSAISVGLVRFINGKESDNIYERICPPSDYFVQEWIDKVHHLTYDDVKACPKFPEVWDQKIIPFIEKTPGFPLVAHNAKFDMSVIWDACNYYHHKLPGYNYFCSLQLSKKVWPELEKHALTFLGQKFGIEYLAHDALEDSRTCGLIVNLAAQKTGCYTIEELLKKCGLRFEKI
jgi:DNA polymerase-3 subunit epsilon